MLGALARYSCFEAPVETGTPPNDMRIENGSLEWACAAQAGNDLRKARQALLGPPFGKHPQMGLSYCKAAYNRKCGEERKRCACAAHTPVGIDNTKARAGIARSVSKHKERRQAG